jgi:hypothetical protein
MLHNALEAAMRVRYASLWFPPPSLLLKAPPAVIRAMEIASRYPEGGQYVAETLGSRADLDEASDEAIRALVEPVLSHLYDERVGRATVDRGAPDEGTPVTDRLRACFPRYFSSVDERVAVYRHLRHSMHQVPDSASDLLDVLRLMQDEGYPIVSGLRCPDIESFLNTLLPDARLLALRRLEAPAHLWRADDLVRGLQQRLHLRLPESLRSTLWADSRVQAAVDEVLRTADAEHILQWLPVPWLTVDQAVTAVSSRAVRPIDLALNGGPGSDGAVLAAWRALPGTRARSTVAAGVTVAERTVAEWTSLLATGTVSVYDIPPSLQTSQLALLAVTGGLELREVPPWLRSRAVVWAAATYAHPPHAAVPCPAVEIPPHLLTPALARALLATWPAELYLASSFLTSLPPTSTTVTGYVKAALRAGLRLADLHAHLLTSSIAEWYLSDEPPTGVPLREDPGAAVALSIIAEPRRSYRMCLRAVLLARDALPYVPHSFLTAPLLVAAFTQLPLNEVPEYHRRILSVSLPLPPDVALDFNVAQAAMISGVALNVDGTDACYPWLSPRFTLLVCTRLGPTDPAIGRRDQSMNIVWAVEEEEGTGEGDEGGGGVDDDDEFDDHVEYDE